MKKLKKIAVCLSGQPRFIKECQNFIKDFFLTDGVEIDYFVHSWSDLSSGKTYNEKGFYANHDVDKNYSHLSEKSTIDSVKKLWIDAYSPKSIIVEDEHTNKDLLNFVDTLYNTFELLKGTEYSYENKIYPKSDNLDTSSGPSNIDWGKIIKEKQKNKDKNGFLRNPNFECISQTYSISKAFELKNQYEKENNFEYDLAFRCRSDLIISGNNNFQALFNRSLTLKPPALLVNNIFVIGNNIRSNDAIYCGPSKCIGKFSNLFNFRFLQFFQTISGIKDWGQVVVEACQANYINHLGGTVILNLFGINKFLVYRSFHKKIKNQSVDSLSKLTCLHEEHKNPKILEGR